MLSKELCLFLFGLKSLIIIVYLIGLVVILLLFFLGCVEFDKWEFRVFIKF